MTLNASLYSFLTAQSPVTDLVSTRIYPAGEAPKTITYPYVTYQRISNRHERHTQGGAALAAPRYEINCWAQSNLDAEAVADAIREAMNDFRGAFGSVQSRGCFLESDDSDIEPPDDGSHVSKHVTRLDFTIWHTETATPV